MRFLVMCHTSLSTWRCRVIPKVKTNIRDIRKNENMSSYRKLLKNEYDNTSWLDGRGHLLAAGLQIRLTPETTCLEIIWPTVAPPSFIVHHVFWFVQYCTKLLCLGITCWIGCKLCYRRCLHFFLIHSLQSFWLPTVVFHVFCILWICFTPTPLLRGQCSLPHRRVHEIKRTYLASRIHGLFIT